MTRLVSATWPALVSPNSGQPVSLWLISDKPKVINILLKLKKKGRPDESVIPSLSTINASRVIFSHKASATRQMMRITLLLLVFSLTITWSPLIGGQCVHSRRASNKVSHLDTSYSVNVFKNWLISQHF